MDMLKVYVVWGECIDEDSKVVAYEFATQAELDAFLQGVDAASGYLDYFASTDRQEADDYLKEKQGE